jgi:hypothetical protein
MKELEIGFEFLTRFCTNSCIVSMLVKQVGYSPSFIDHNGIRVVESLTMMQLPEL